MTDAANSDGDLLVKAAAFMAAARALGSTSAEVKLAMERIAREFNAVRSEVSSGGDFEERISALENNQLLIINGLSQLVDVTPPFSGTVTLSVTPSDASVTWTLADGSTATGATVTVALGQTVSYTADKAGYRAASGSVFVNQVAVSVSVSLTQLTQTAVSMSGDFADTYGLLSTLVDGQNFERGTNCIQSGPLSYNIHNSSVYGYIAFKTGTATTLSVTCEISSESADRGAVYCGTAIYKPTNSQISGGTTDGKGSYLFRTGGTVASKAYTLSLSANTQYYLCFAYCKDGSVNTGSDRLKITAISFDALV